MFCTESVTFGDIGEADGGAVVVADDQRLVICGVADLIVGDDVGGHDAVGELAARLMRILQAQHGLNAGKRQTVAVELSGIHVDAHGGQCAAAGVDLAHALNLRELLLDDGGGFVVQLAPVVDLRGEADDHDGRVGRIHLAIGGIGGQIGRQIGSRGVDGGFHVARRAVDVAAEIELDGDAGGAERTGGGHLRDAGDVAELPLQRSGDRRGHDLRAGAGQGGADGDGGEIHLRQRRDRQHSERKRSGEGDRDRQQRGGHRPMDE